MKARTICEVKSGSCFGIFRSPREEMKLKQIKKIDGTGPKEYQIRSTSAILV